jgi:hypothetical protein
MKSNRSNAFVLALLMGTAATFWAPIGRAQQAPPDVTSTAAPVPRLVQVGGIVKETAGQPVASITFALYKDQEGGAPIWMETQNVALDASGRYSVLLGSTTTEGLGQELFTSGAARWLGVRPQGQPEQQRVLLLSVPYALKAADAETIGGLPPSAFALASPPNHGGTTESSRRADAAATPAISGTGTANFIPKWTTSTNLGNSNIFQNGSGMIGIGTTTPMNLLDVKGAGIFRSTLTLVPAGMNQTFSISGTAFNISSTGLVHFIAGQTFPGSGTITGVTAGTDLTGGGTSGNVTLNLDVTKVPRLTFANHFTASQFFRGNGEQMIVGDPGCGSGFAGIGFGALSGCTNYSLIGDGKNTFINRPTGGSIIFRENNGGQMAIAPGGAVTITETAGGCCPAALTTTPSEGNDGVNAFGGGGPSEFGIGGSGLLAKGGSETNTNSQFGGDGVDAFGGNAFQGGTGVFAQGGNSSQVGGADGIDATAGTGPTGNGFSGFFQGGDVNVLGNLGVSGQIFAGVKDFRIDHPLSPANKYLYHASVESSEMMNIYTGNVTLDGTGAASVELPAWFEAVNGDYRYQLTSIGAAAPNLHIAREVANHQFSIAGGAPGMKVSWQVTGVRQDAFARANPLVVEVDKPANERGFYLNPELYGQPEEKQIEWGRSPAKMRRLKERRAGPRKPLSVNEESAQVRPLK